MSRTPYASVPGDDLISNDGSHNFTTSVTTATAGGIQAVPATVRGYVLINVNGVPKKIPYFDV